MSLRALLEWFIVALVILIFFVLYLRAGGKSVNLEIPPSCVKKIELKDCDMNVSPPKCKFIAVDYYPASCAIVHLQ